MVPEWDSFLQVVRLFAYQAFPLTPVVYVKGLRGRANFIALNDLR